MTVHVGTNDLLHDPADCIVKEPDESVTDSQACNPDCQVTFSCSFIEKDLSNLSEKGQVVNHCLNERLMV